MTAYPFFQVVKNGPHQQVDALERSEQTFHVGQAFITTHGIFGGKFFFTFIGAYYVDAIQLLFTFDRFCFSLKGKMIVFYR
jgi:hypothetical protein